MDAEDINQQYSDIVLDNDLIDSIFVGMLRDEDILLYFNKATNDVQQLVEGYLSSIHSSDQPNENRKLADRIMLGADSDDLIDGIHFLIPQLNIKIFLDVFQTYADDNKKLIPFKDDFLNTMSTQYSNFSSDQQLNDKVLSQFLSELQNWIEQKHVDQFDVQRILNDTRLDIVENFLQYVFYGANNY